MKLTYSQALSQIIETTEVGYTIASQDRLWIAFIFDLWSEGEHLALRYNRLYPRGLSQPLHYDLLGTGVLVWTTRREAEAYAEQWQAYLDLHTDDGSPRPEVYVMNLGDDARYEATVIGRYSGAQCRTTPKFKGSERAWEALVEMTNRWVKEVSPKIAPPF